MKIKLPLEKMSKAGSDKPVLKYRFLTYCFKIDFIKAALHDRHLLVYLRVSSTTMGVRYLSEEGFVTVEDALRVATTEGITVLPSAESHIEQFLELGLVKRVEEAGLDTTRSELCYLARRASRLKTYKFSQDSLGAFEALEEIVAGILNNEALWAALSNLNSERGSPINLSERQQVYQTEATGTVG